MSGVASIGMMAAMAVGGIALTQMMSKPKDKAASTPAAAVAPPQAQAASTPDEVARRNTTQQQGAYGPGAATTMLTDSAGVDPNELSLGKNTLFGQ